MSLTNITYANKKKTSVIATHPRHGKMVVTERDDLWSEIDHAKVSPYIEPDTNEIDREFGIQALARKKLEEEYDALPEKEKRKLHKK